MAITLANRITILRILAIPLFVAMVLQYTPEKEHLRFGALAVFLFAVISDGVDGYIARKLNQRTKVGAILDPLADKVLLMSAFICLYKVGASTQIDQFPVWLVVTVISRDAILLVGTMLIYLMHKEFSVSPSLLGKGTTVCQMACIACTLIRFEYIEPVWFITALVSVSSLIEYIYQGMHILNGPTSQNFS